MAAAVSANARATRLLREGSAREALAILEETLRDTLTPKARSIVLANKGLCLEQLGQLDAAVEALEEATRGSGDAQFVAILRQMRASQLMARATELAGSIKFEEALRCFEEAGKLDPEAATDDGWKYNVAVMLSKLGRIDEALEILLDLSEDLNLPLLGELLCKKQRWEEAVATIDRAIADDVELPASLLFNYGVASLKLGDPSKARKAFEDVVAYYPNYGLAYDALASIDAQEGASLCQKGQFGDAIPKLYAAVRRTAKVSTLYNLALALLKERRAPEAKEQFDHLLKMAPDNKNAKAGLDAAELMIEGGNYKEKKVEPLLEDDDDDESKDAAAAASYLVSPSMAPKKRIYQIAEERGVGSLAGQDDMVQLLSGIEEWVSSALGPLEQRVVALEEAAEAQGGIVGSASEDRAVLQMLFDRVAAVEENQGGHPSLFFDEEETTTETVYDDGTVVSGGERRQKKNISGVTPDLAARFDSAALSRKLTQVSGGADVLDRRLQAVEKLILGNAAAQGTKPQHRMRLSGEGLLADEDLDDDDDDQKNENDDTKGDNAAAADSESSMSLVARLAVQEQRFAKMSAELESQAKDIQKLKAQLLGGGGDSRNPFGTGGPANFKIPSSSSKTTTPTKTPGANIGKRDMPNVMDELKAATKRRAAKRREMGLTLAD